MIDMAAIPEQVQEMIVALLQFKCPYNMFKLDYSVAVLGSAPFASVVFLDFRFYDYVDPLVKPILCLGWGNSCVFPKTSTAYTEAAYTRLDPTTSTLWRGWHCNSLSTSEFIPPANPSYEEARIAMLDKTNALDKEPMECVSAADLSRCQQAALQDIPDKPTYGPLWLVPHGDVSDTDAPRFDTEHYEEHPHSKPHVTHFGYGDGWDLAW